jgi:hypothetical protein
MSLKTEYDASTDDGEWDWNRQEIETEEDSDEDCARALQLVEDGKCAAEENPEIIPFEKGFELCCIRCRCGKCNDAADDNERVRNICFHFILLLIFISIVLVLTIHSLFVSILSHRS